MDNDNEPVDVNVLAEDGDMRLLLRELGGRSPRDISDDWSSCQVTAVIFMDLWQKIDRRQNPFVRFGWVSYDYLRAFTMIRRAQVILSGG